MNAEMKQVNVLISRLALGIEPLPHSLFRIHRSSF